VNNILFESNGGFSLIKIKATHWRMENCVDFILFFGKHEDDGATKVGQFSVKEMYLVLG